MMTSTFLQRLLVAVVPLVVLAAFTGRTYAADAAVPQPPNILVIVADDLGWNDVGWHGSEILTPHLDKLAAGGLRLEQHYVTPMCSSTRCGLLSGRYPSRYGLLGATNNQVFPFGKVTLATALASSGYHTAITGKWHLGSRPETGPLKFGFHESHGSLAGGVDQYGHFYKDGPHRRTWHRNDEYFEEEGHATDLFTREAIRQIETPRDEPWFVYVAFTAVHIPLQEPREWMRLYDRKIDDPSRKVYAACVSHLDDCIGQIVAALDRTGQREETLIVFTSDNGGSHSWTDTQQYGGGHIPCPVLGDNTPLRGWKGQVYEGGIRVPALAHWQGAIEPGECEQPVHIVDWFPTIAALVGYPADDSLQFDGSNIWPLLSGKVEQLPERTLYWKRANNSFALRHGPWKLHADGKRRELYNLADDPNEQHDLAAQQPQRVAALEELLAEARQADQIQAGIK